MGAALIAAGYEVFAINPMSVARYRERHSTSGAKSDAADAHMLAEIVRLDRAHHRPVAGDSELVRRSSWWPVHQSLVWDRTRHVLRLRGVREFFPAALEAFADLDAADTLELLAIAPDPERAARLSKTKITAALRRANRRSVEEKPTQIQSVLRAPALRQSAAGPSGLRGDRPMYRCWRRLRYELKLLLSISRTFAALSDRVTSTTSRDRRLPSRCV